MRAFAVQQIMRVTHQGLSLSQLQTNEQFSARDNALIQHLCYGVIRYYFSLSAIAKKLLQKPLKDKDQDVYTLLLVGLYQILHLNTPEHAAVSETVKATKQLKKPWAKGLLNACLRRFLREREAILSGIQTINHPDWLSNRIREAWPDDADDLLMANDSQAPMVLRVNLQKISRAQFLESLAPTITAHACRRSRAGVCLHQPMAVYEIPGFKQGWFSVQDEAAQLAVEFLQIETQQTVLDACAAPGGKTTHILEQANEVQVTAIDKDDRRCEKIHENLQRLGLSANVVCADSCYPQQAWGEILYDRILLDAPCSATGVIRRHPDIKLLRQAKDITNLAKTQLFLLNQLSTLLKKDGLLMYCTCSVLPEENDNIIKQFIGTRNDIELVELQAQDCLATRFGLQSLPHRTGMDGFYYCLMRKN